jgi:general stress protein 26
MRRMLLLKTREEALQFLKALFSKQNLAVLATQHQGKPYENLIAFAHTDDLEHLIFATTRSTRKFSYISEDARVSLLIDNRTNREADFHEATAVTALGRTEEVEEESEFFNLYINKFPFLRDFVSSPTCALLKVFIEKYIIVQKFQNVTEVDICR